MSTQFEFKKFKKWFKWHIIIKKIITKMKESEKIIKKIMKVQEIIENNIKYETNSEIIIIDNIFV